MNTLAWVLILAALLVVHAVYRGRVFNMGEDLSDAFIALVSSDTAGLKEVMERRGDSTTASAANLSLFQPSLESVAGPGIGIAKGIGQGLDEFERKANASVSLAAVLLGEKAKGYRWGASGPDYYDCSGLIWQAMKLTKVYTGKRFTTSNFVSATKGIYTRVDSPQVDDIVLWPLRIPYATGHMGVVTGPDKFYSARSVRSGIGESPIKSFRSHAPQYYRRSGFKHPDAG